MSPFITRFRPWLEPAVAVIFVVLWMIAEAGRYHLWSDVALLIGFGASIGLARVAPVWSLALIGALLALQSLRIAPLPDSTTWPVYLAIIGVAFIVGNAPMKHERVRWIALVCGVPFTGAVALLMAVPSPGETPRWTSWVGGASSGTYIASALINISVVGIAIYIGAWAIGFVLRVNALQLRSRFLLEHTARDLAVAETELVQGRDRDWIAQEVHDLLAHSLAVVTAQADGARLSPNADVGSKDAALLAISGAARDALIDMQALVVALREQSSDGPQPTLADLPGLLDRLASAGMRVTVAQFGQSKDLTPARELAVFRVLQESLTNSLRHAGSSVPARVAFDWRGPGLALSVTTERPTGFRAESTRVPGAVSAVPGHGIRGMQDRARLAGGWLTAGAVDEPDATFIVAAFFPAEEAADRASEQMTVDAGSSTNGDDLNVMAQLESGRPGDGDTEAPSKNQPAQSAEDR